jgi:hypothetical protein
MRTAEVVKVTGIVDLIRFFEAGGCTDAETVAERYRIDLRTAQRFEGKTSLAGAPSTNRATPTFSWNGPTREPH